jgi:hypothetical protein
MEIHSIMFAIVGTWAGILTVESKVVCQDSFWEMAEDHCSLVIWWSNIVNNSTDGSMGSLGLGRSLVVVAIFQI